MINPDMIWLS